MGSGFKAMQTSFANKIFDQSGRFMRKLMTEKKKRQAGAELCQAQGKL